jgi:hypothetical protein
MTDHATHRIVYDGKVTMIGDKLYFDGRLVDPAQLKNEAKKND